MLRIPRIGASDRLLAGAVRAYVTRCFVRQCPRE
jgi:hypothetical protein